MYRASIIRDLGFVKETPIGLNYWSEEEMLSWNAGNEVGRERARQFVSFIRQHQDPSLLFRLGKDMIRTNAVNAMLVGFNYELSRFLLK